MNKVELLLESKTLLGEGPCWDDQNQILYWVDILGKNLHIYDPATQNDKTINLGYMPGCVVCRKDGGLTLALESGYFTMDLETAKLTFLIDPELSLLGNRFNDGKCDPAGRFLAGTMAKDAQSTVGSLYSLNAKYQIRKLVSGVTISNGMGWSPDYKTFYYIDSPTRKIMAYDYDLETGNISKPRIAFTLSYSQGTPDGMTTDREGMLWVAHWGGAQITRWNPETGKLIQSIPIPAYQVSSCTFGGKNMDELYITTARDGLKPDMLEKYPLSGSLFRFKTNVQGMTNFQFAG